MGTVILGVLSSFIMESGIDSHVEAWNSRFLSSCKRGVRLPVELRLGTWVLSRGATGEPDLPSCWEEILGVPFEAFREIKPYLEWMGK